MLLTIAFITVSLKAALLSNHSDTCTLLKSDLHKISRVFHELSDTDRDRLYSFSMRGMTHSFLKKVTFLNQELERSKRTLLAETEPLWNLYKDWKDPDSQIEEQIVEQTVQQLEQKDIQYNSAGNHSAVVSTKLKQNKLALFQMIEIMKTEIQDILTKSRLVKEISGTFSMQMSLQENNYSLSSVLEDLRQYFASYPKILKKIAAIQHLLQDYLQLQRTLEVEQQSQDDFSLANTSKINRDVADLQQNLSDLNSNLNSLKQELNADLEAIAQDLQEQITSVSNYSEFQSLLLETKQLVAQQIKSQIIQINLSEELTKASYATSTLNFQRLRIRPDEVLDLQMNILKVNRLKSTVPDQLEYQTSQIKVQVSEFLKKNQARLGELDQVHQMETQRWQLLQDLLHKERQLDRLFALALADLQGGSSKNPDFRCFSVLEVSVYVYFMNVTQVIVSKHTFYKHFLESLEVEYSTQLIKQISKDFEGRPLQDPEMIDVYNFSLVPGGLEKWVSRYSFLVNEDLDNLFEAQAIGYKDHQVSLTHKILNASGFTFGIAKDILKEGVLSAIFDKIVLALWAAFSAAKMGSVELAFLGTLLSCMTEIFVGWLGSKIDSAKIMEAFNRQKMLLLDRFARKELEYLDLEDSLKQVADLQSAKDQQAKVKTVPHDPAQVYKQLFLQMVELETCYRVAVSMDSIDGNFI